jgi:hypothetical protein
VEIYAGWRLAVGTALWLDQARRPRHRLFCMCLREHRAAHERRTLPAAAHSSTAAAMEAAAATAVSPSVLRFRNADRHGKRERQCQRDRQSSHGNTSSNAVLKPPIARPPLRDADTSHPQARKAILICASIAEIHHQTPAITKHVMRDAMDVCSFPIGLDE